jgi:hypothetical protein
MFHGYVRVSSTKGRSGESFISPQVQRYTIERLAAMKGLELGDIVEELDVSGSRRVAERELGRLVDKVESGESEGSSSGSSPASRAPCSIPSRWPPALPAPADASSQRTSIRRSRWGRRFSGF